LSLPSCVDFDYGHQRLICAIIPTCYRIYATVARLDYGGSDSSEVVLRRLTLVWRWSPQPATSNSIRRSIEGDTVGDKRRASRHPGRDQQQADRLEDRPVEEVDWA
jgi:hypothetical protein